MDRLLTGYKHYHKEKKKENRQKKEKEILQKNFSLPHKRYLPDPTGVTTRSK
jgi:hypothetical protein